LEKRYLELEKKYTFSMDLYEGMMKRMTNTKISVGLLTSRYETYPPQQFDLTVGEEDAVPCRFWVWSDRPNLAYDGNPRNWSRPSVRSIKTS